MSGTPPVAIDVDGRTINVWLGGAPDGLPLVVHRGTPSPPVFSPKLDATASGLGLQTITIARPGYSGSTRQRGRDIAAIASDVAAVLDELGHNDFVSWGHSGGGPHVLACAALLPDRCLAALSSAGVAPFDADGLDWLGGMADENIEEFEMILKGEDALRPYLTEYAERFRAVSGEDVAASLRGLVPSVDRAALTGEAADVMAASLREVSVSGVEGWMDDDLAFVSDWGFELSAINVPVAIWHGGLDKMVPFSHGVWLDAHIRTSRARLFEDEGHLSLHIGRLSDLLEDLLDLAG